MDLTVDSSLIAALAVQLVFVVGLPILLLVQWHRRTHANLFPAVIGVVIFLVFAQMLEQVLHYACLFNNNPVSRAIGSNPWLYALYGGLAAGLFEETGRYMGFKYLLKRYPDRETAIGYGLGHGGYECIAVAGMSALAYLVLAAFIRTGAISAVQDMFNSQELSVIEDVLAQVAATTPFTCIWAVIERVIALALHVSLSVIVFAAVWQPGTRGTAYLAAIGLHAVANIPAGLYQAGVLTGNRGMVAAELLTLVITLCVVWWARRIWRELPVEVSADRSDEP